MAKQSAYLKKIQNKTRVRLEVDRIAERETTAQFMLDMLTLTLNDPEIMGKNVFGKKRLERFINAFHDKCALYNKAISDDVETDYIQIKMEKALGRIFQEDLVPFGERYPWLKDMTK